MADELIEIEIVGDADRYARSTSDAVRATLDLQRAQIALNVAMEAANVLYEQVIAKNVETIDKVHTLADASGLAADTVNGLRLAADATGKTLESLVPRELSVKLAQAQAGSTKAARAFQLAGVSADELAEIGLDTDAALRLLVGRLSQIPDAGRRAAAATMTMGSAGQQLLSAFENQEQLDDFIRKGREFGIKVGPEAAAAAASWQAATADLNLALEDVSASVFAAFGGDAADMVRKFALGFFYASNVIVESGNQISDQFRRLASGDLTALIARPAELQAVLDRAFDRTYRFWEESERRLAEQVAQGPGAEGEAIAPAVRASAAAVVDLTSAYRALQAVTDAATASGLSQEEAIQRLYRERLTAIEDVIAALVRQGATVEQLAQIEDAFGTATLAAAEDRARALSALDAAALTEREAWWAGVTRLADDAAQRADQALDDALRADRDRVQAQIGSYGQIATAGLDIVSSAIDVAGQRTRAGALRAFRAQQAIGMAQAGLNAAIAASNALATTFAPPPIPVLAAAAMAAVGAAQAAAIGAQQPPSFHIGSRAADLAPDEQLIRKTRSEVVLTPQGQDVADANAGIGSGGGDVFVVVDHVAVGVAAATSAARAGTPLYNAIRRGDLPGHSRSRR